MSCARSGGECCQGDERGESRNRRESQVGRSLSRLAIGISGGKVALFPESWSEPDFLDE